MKNFSKLEKEIGVKFDNQDFLKQAMVHRSYLNEHPAFKISHNERLEFLGDAVLEIIVTEYLFFSFPVKKYVYLKNGAMYSVFFLGMFMILKSFGVHIPEWASPVITFGVIAFFFLKSR